MALPSAGDALPDSRLDNAPRRRVHLAASPGGHIQLLRSLGEVFEDYERHWITSPGAQADDLRAAGELVHEVPRVKGVAKSAWVKNAWAGAKLATSERPELVVTSGAALVVPFCLVARLLGATLVFAETMARVRSRSRTSKILGRFAAKEFVQWPELQEGSTAERVWPVYLEDLPTGKPTAGQGTILTLGTHNQPFDRLVRMVEVAQESGTLSGPVQAQVGYTTVAATSALDARQWYTPGEIAEAFRNADVVVTHAGAGTIFAALRAGKRPIVCDRQQRLGEHRDDHQRELVVKLSELDLIVPVEDEITAQHVQRAHSPLAGLARPADVPSLRDALKDFLDSRNGKQRG